MKNKVLVGTLSALLVLGGAIAVAASNNDDQRDDKSTSIITNTENLPQITEGQKLELETEHGETFYKVESDDNSAATSSQTDNTSAITVEEAAKIATSEVSGKITEIEREMEHGRLEYKFEIQSNRGEADVRVDAETGEITRVKFDDSDDKYDDDDDDRNERRIDDDNSNDDKGWGNDDTRDN
jgi:uncharacterized membrane protein YkoI